MTKILCPKCKYEWDTRSLHIYVSCPSCLKKVKIEDNRIDDIQDLGGEQSDEPYTENPIS
jgi:predicted Zn-ribbon and HTH transcriptional regulator